MCVTSPLALLPCVQSLLPLHTLELQPSDYQEILDWIVEINALDKLCLVIERKTHGNRTKRKAFQRRVVRRRAPLCFNASFFNSSLQK